MDTTDGSSIENSAPCTIRTTRTPRSSTTRMGTGEGSIICTQCHLQCTTRMRHYLRLISRLWEVLRSILRSGDRSLRDDLGRLKRKPQQSPLQTMMHHQDLLQLRRQVIMRLLDLLLLKQATVHLHLPQLRCNLHTRVPATIPITHSWHHRRRQLPRY